MKQMLRKKDVWVLLAALIGAFACVTLIQLISGRIDVYENDGTFSWGADKPWNAAASFRLVTIMLATDY